LCFDKDGAVQGKAKVVALGSYVPERVLSNADLEKMVDTNDEWIVTRTGIRERRIARDDECTSDMGLIAAQRCLEKAGKEPGEIDLILCGTSTPDFVFPSTAALIQRRLAAGNAAAFDFQAACTGFIYGLSLAKAFIESGLYRNILLIAAEKLSSVTDYTDRATCILFGDGASAALISAASEGFAIEHVSLGADGDESSILTIPAGSARLPATAETVAAKQHYIQMEGRELFKHGVRRMVQSSLEGLDALGLTTDQIDWLVPHQANKRIIDSVAKRLNFPMEKIYLTVQKYGNTSASSVPLAMDELMNTHPLEQGSRLLLTSFGAGLTWGSAILRRV
jgi:3-oxoacyl-[acyl-carrier-protein] synthase III